MLESVTPQDRFYGSLPYILPLSASVVLGSNLFAQIPFLVNIYLPFILFYRNVLMFPIVSFLGITGEFVIFILLFTLVMRNPQVSRFVRFNVMQAFLLQIILFIVQILIRFLEDGVSGMEGVSYILQILVNTTFMGVAIACGYAVYQSIMGEYSEIPGISEAAMIQSDR
jgi:hypothetical protein